MRIGYFGIGELGAAVLNKLLDNSGTQVIYIVSKDDSVDVSLLAEKNSIPNFVVSMREDLSKGLFSIIKKIDIDYIIVSGFHRLIPECILELPKSESINIHLGQLPRWKGPISWRWAIIHGCCTFHITYMLMTEKLDVGRIIEEIPIPILLSDNEKKLFLRCVKIASENIIGVLNKLIKNELNIREVEQTNDYYSYLRNNDLLLTEQMSVMQAYNLIRGTTPKPLARIQIDGEVRGVLDCKIILNSSVTIPKEYYQSNQSVRIVEFSDGLLEVVTVQLL